MTTAEIPAATPVAAETSNRPIPVLARTLGISQGQASTMLIALGLAGVLTLGGLPPVLRNRSNGEAAPASSVAPLESPATATTPEEPGGGDLAAPSFSDPGTATPSFGGPATPRFGGTGSGTGSGTTSPGFDGGSDGGTPARRPAPATGESEVFASVTAAGPPEGIAVSRDGHVYVAAGPDVLTYDAAGDAGRRFTVGGEDVALTGLALDGKGGLIALDATSGRVQRINLETRRQTTYSTLVDLPACELVVAAVSGCEPGIQDDAPLPRAAAFDAAGNLFVADAAQGAVWRIPAGGGKPVLFTADAAFGSGDGLAGIAVDGASILVASPQALDPEAAAGGAIYRIAIGQGGKAGERTLVASFAPPERPAGLVVLPDRSMVVALHEANAVVLLDAEGTEVRRVSGPAGETPMDSPTGVALLGDTVLVTNRAAEEADWAVLAVGVR